MHTAAWDCCWKERSEDMGAHSLLAVFTKIPHKLFDNRSVHHTDACVAHGTQWANAICVGLSRNLLLPNNWLSKNGKPEIMPSYGFSGLRGSPGVLTILFWLRSTQS